MLAGHGVGNFGRWISLVAGCAILSAGAEQPNKARPALPWWERAIEAQVGHYFLKTDLPAEQARDLARHLNVMYDEYSRRLAALPPRAKEHLDVYIFAQQRDYLDTLRTRFGVNATGSGGMFFITGGGGGSGLAFFTSTDKGPLPPQRVAHVLQHEGFHQFASSRFGGDLPIWVNEGLAEFFGESILFNETLILGQANPRVLDAVKDAIETKTYVPFQQMLTMSSAKWNENVKAGRARLQYSQAWSMVHFLVYADPGGDGRPDYQAAFERYLRLINDGVRSEGAFVRAFETDEFDAFELRWRNYALAARPTAFVTAMERIEFLAEGALELSRRGVFPGSLESLRDELRRVGFTWALVKHDRSVTLSAAEDSLFQIPKDDLTIRPPAFEVTAMSLKGLTGRQRAIEQANPTPPTIATRDLEPRDLSIGWRRDDAQKIEGYEIVVR